MRRLVRSFWHAQDSIRVMEGRRRLGRVEYKVGYCLTFWAMTIRVSEARVQVSFILSYRPALGDKLPAALTGVGPRIYWIFKWVFDIRVESLGERPILEVKS